MVEKKETLGKKIRKYRKISGMTMKELGMKLDLSEQAISQYERDKRKPNILILKEIARIFNITLEDLLNDDFENLDRNFVDSLIRERTGIIANLNVTEVENLENILNLRNPLLVNFEILNYFKAYRELIPDEITIEDYFSLATLFSENMISAIKLFLSKYNQTSRLDKLDKYSDEFNDFLSWLKEDFSDNKFANEKYFDHFSKQDKHLIMNYYDVVNDAKHYDNKK